MTKTVKTIKEREKGMNAKRKDYNLKTKIGEP